MASNVLDFSEILASSIHDMKNSLGMVLSSLEEVIDLESGECRCTAERVAQLQYEAKRVNDDLIQLLTLYRVGKGQYTPAPEEHSVADFLEEVYLRNKPLFRFKGVAFELEADNDLFWYFDRDLMSGVLENVVTNTLRYTKDRMRLSAAIEDGWLRMRIEDNGTGFPDRMLVSGPGDYQKVDFASGRTGLGLYFCSAVAALHTSEGRSGYIALSNDGVFGGGCFAISLP